MGISWFRGSGGEMVQWYVSPASYVSALPLVIIAFLVTLGASQAGSWGTVLGSIVLSLCYVIALFRFAVAASRKRFEPSNDPGEIWPSMARYLLLTAAWVIPLGLISYFTADNWGTLFAAALSGGGLNLAAAGATGLALLLVTLVASLLPTLTLLMALRHDTLPPLFSVAGWKWLLVERGEDLVPFYALLIGGGFTMAAVSIVPAALLIVVVASVNPEAGAAVSIFLYAWGASTVPVLVGRVAGAFVAADSVAVPSPPPEFSHFAPVPLVKVTSPAREAIPVNDGASPAPTEPRPDPHGVEKEINALPAADLPGALAAAAEKEKTAPLRMALEVTLLALRIGDRPAAVASASRGADLAAGRGFGDIAFFLVSRVGNDRTKLTVAPLTLDVAGKVYEQREALMDAAWCYHTAAVRAGDLLKAQKRLFQVAEAALKMGKLKEAARLFDLLLEKYPDSMLADFARQGREKVRRLTGS